MPKFVAFAAALITLAITATSAHAETTRAEFVAQVDPICQAGQAQEAAAAAALLKQLKRSNARHNRRGSKKRDRAFLRLFDQIAAIEHGVNAQIATVPPAPPDVSLIQVWLRARGESVDTLARAFHAIAHNKVLKGFGLFFQGISLYQEANDIVRDFGFQYCAEAPQSIKLF